MVYTSKAHRDLPRQFGGAPWRHALKMALAMPQADWLIVTNLHGDWLPIKKSQIAQILDVPRAEPTGMESSAEAKGTGDDELERLIGNAGEWTGGDWSDSWRHALAGRELFLKMFDQRSEDGQSKMVTSEVGGVGGLVQAYTSRRRTGITYGGMSWESIVGIIEENPNIPGVHIINDDDDWVVLSRSQISS